MKITKNNVINFMIICLPLCPYKIFSIGDKDISFIYLAWGILAIVGILDIPNLIWSFKKNWIVLLALFYFIFHALIFKNKNFGSIFQLITFWSLLFLSYRRVTYKGFANTISLFHKLMDFMAMYGIYQIIGRLFHLPLSDLWIEGYMVEGYNWYNTVKIGGLTLSRSNGFFMEPSLFSQYLALNILLYFFSEEIIDKGKLVKIIINVVALLCSFSGTGLILLCAGVFCIFLSKQGGEIILKIIKKNFILVGISILAGIGVLLSPLGKYLISRLSEFDPTNPNSISAYIRFVGPYNIAMAVFKQHPWFGLGFGNVQNFVASYRRTGSASAHASVNCAVIIPRYLAELGLIGLILLLLMYKNFFRRERLKNLSYRVLVICIIILTVLCDSDIAVNYWFLLYLTNIDLKNDMVKREGRDLV